MQSADSRGPTAASPARASGRATLRAGVISVAVGAAIMVAKFVGFLVTGSSAVFADAAESIVNVIAGSIATYSVAVAARPADADHPYGHGKAEVVSAAVEGALILLAATVVALEAVREMIVGPALQQLDVGIAVSAAAGLGNLALGLYLVRVGRRYASHAIAADGAHVLTDVVTTAGTVAALIAVKLTGIELLDPLAALAVGANIMRTGWNVMRRALRGLLDEADFELLSRLAARLEKARRPEWVDLHQLRTWSSGSLHHFDLHLAVPRYFSIEQAHRIGDEIEALLVDVAAGRADAVVHLDPCTPRHCTGCAMAGCLVRSADLVEPLPLTVESVTRPGII